MLFRAERVQHSPGIGSSPLVRQTFVSSYHHTPRRRHITPEQRQRLADECTDAALEELYESPGFKKYLLDNRRNLSILRQPMREERPVDEIAATALMEEAEVIGEEDE